MSSDTRIYVACLASYNAGRLHGAWIDATQDADDIRREIAEKVLRTSPCPNVRRKDCACPGCGYGWSAQTDGEVGPPAACPECGNGAIEAGEEYGSSEEWAIHDYEGFAELKLSEYEDRERVAELARLIGEHDGAFLAYAGYVGTDHATEEGFRDAYSGEYASPEDYTQEWAEGAYGSEKLGPLENYIDWGRYASGLEHDGVTFVPGGAGVYVFINI